MTVNVVRLIKDKSKISMAACWIIMSLPTTAGVSLIGSSVFFLVIGAVSPASVSKQNSG